MDPDGTIRKNLDKRRNHRVFMDRVDCNDSRDVANLLTVSVYIAHTLIKY